MLERAQAQVGTFSLVPRHTDWTPSFYWGAEPWNVRLPEMQSPEVLKKRRSLLGGLVDE